MLNCFFRASVCLHFAVSVTLRACVFCLCVCARARVVQSERVELLAILIIGQLVSLSDLGCSAREGRWAQNLDIGRQGAG